MDGDLRVSSPDGTWSGIALPAAAPPLDSGIGWAPPGGTVGGGSAGTPCRVPFWVPDITLRGPEEHAGGVGLVEDSPSGVVPELSSAVSRKPVVPSSRRRSYSPGGIRHPVPLGEPIPLAVGINEFWVSSGTDDNTVHVQFLREEALHWFLPFLNPYQVAQVSVTVFVVGYCMLLHMQVSSFFAAPLLAVIPILRICPEMSRLLFSGEVSTARHMRSLQSAGALLLAVWLSYMLLASMRPPSSSPAAAPVVAPEPPVAPLDPWPVPHPRNFAPADCMGLPGLNCSAALSTWAGPRGCPVLALTDGTCASYCGFYNRSCIKAYDDVGTGACALREDLRPSPSSRIANGCMQRLNTQVCACGPLEAGSRWQPLRFEEQEATSEGSCNCGPKRRFELSPHKTPDAGTSPRSYSQEHCFRLDVKYEPLDMPGRGRMTAGTAAECQHRCDNTNGCAYFTWFPATGRCHFQTHTAKLYHALGAVAGPANCADEEMLAEIRGEPRPPPPAATVDGGLYGSATFAEPFAPAPVPKQVRHSPAFQQAHLQHTLRTPPFAEGSPVAVFLVLIGFAITAGTGLLTTS